jgi:hypothetical protein
MPFGPPSPAVTVVTPPVPGTPNDPALAQTIFVDALDTAYSRGRVLVSCARGELDIGPDAAFELVYFGEAETVEMVLVWHMAYRVPSPLPGSANRTGASTGATAATRGALRLRTRAKDCTVVLTIEPLTLPGTLGSGASATCIGGTGVYAWDSDDVLFPTGVSPGDLMSIRVAMRVTDLDNIGKLTHFAVIEPTQTDLTP